MVSIDATGSWRSPRTQNIAFKAVANGIMFGVREKSDHTFYVWCARVNGKAHSGEVMRRKKHNQFLESFGGHVVGGEHAREIRDAFLWWRNRTTPERTPTQSMSLYVAVMLAYCRTIQK